MAPSLVQSKSATGASGTSLTVTLTSATTAGNCLVVCVGGFDNTTNPQVSGVTLGGSAGNFASANTAYNDADANAATWVDPNCAGGQTSVVISFTHDAGGGPQTTAWVMEWSGLVTSSVVDRAPVGVNGSGTTWSSGSSGTLSQASEVAIGVICMATIGTLTTPGSPWTELAQLTTTSLIFGVGYQVVSATTALTYNGSTSASGFFGTCLVTLKAATATPAGVTPSGVLAVPRSLPPRRAITLGRAVPGRLPSGAVPVPAVPRSLPPRRAITAGRAVPGVAAVTRIPAGSLLAPRRRLARAWIWFTPVRTVNAVPPPPVNGTLPLGARLAARRTLARAVTRAIPVPGVPPAVLAATGGPGRGPDDYRRLIRRRELRIIGMRL